MEQVHHWKINHKATSKCTLCATCSCVPGVKHTVKSRIYWLWRNTINSRSLSVTDFSDFTAVSVFQHFWQKRFCLAFFPPHSNTTAPYTIFKCKPSSISYCLGQFIFGKYKPGKTVVFPCERLLYNVVEIYFGKRHWCGPTVLLSLALTLPHNPSF